MKRLAATLAVLAACQAHAQQLEFKGVPFGATMKEFKEAQPDFQCLSTDCFARGNAMQYAGVPAKITAEFADGKLAVLTVYFNPSYSGIISEALASKYGDPTTVKASEFKTRGGATATNDEREWQRPDGSFISVARYGSAINEGRAQMLSADGVRAKAAQLEKLKQQSKKDI